MKPAFYISEKTLRKFLFVVIAIEIFLVLVYLTDYLFGKPSLIIHNLFDLDGEMNIPALFSAAQLFIVGVVFLFMAYQHRQQHYFSLLFLIIVGAGFIFLSFDEAFSIHEEITLSFKHIDWIPRFKGNHGIWIAPYIIAGLIIFILSYKNLVKMWKKNRRESSIIAIGFVIFLLGAVGLEVISYQLRGGLAPWYLYKLEVVFEEFFEMVGISIVLYGALLLQQVKTI
jgi:hypothetical protein